MHAMSLVEEALGGPTVFRDLAKLDFDYVPESLPHRDDAVRFLTRTFKGLTQGGSREHALLWGPVGTGKTVVAKHFTRLFKAALTKQAKHVEIAYINCRSRKSAGLAMLGILSHFDPHYPERGFSVGEMLQDLKRQLERKDCHLLVILDEVDSLLKTDGSDLIYDLTRFSMESGPTWNGVSLLMVSQENVLPMLDAAALSTFKATNTYKMEPYAANALEGIVQQRVDLAFHPGAVDGDTVCLVADIASSEGNARLAIEILQKAGRLADDEGKGTVSPEEVRAAKAFASSYITTPKLLQMPKHPLLVLLALARRLRKGDAYATTGSVEESYKLVCEEFGETARAHTQFWKYLNQLRDGGFILSRISGKGHAGTTQLISIPDMPAHAVEPKVIEILARPREWPAGT